jgi:hypothetical protein
MPILVPQKGLDATAHDFGIVRKSVPIEVVVQSIRAAAQGHVQCSPAATALLVREMQTPMESQVAVEQLPDFEPVVRGQPSGTSAIRQARPRCT